MKYFVIMGLISLLISAAHGQPVQIKAAEDCLRQADNGDWIFDNGHYLIRFAEKHGYAGVEVRILAGSGRRLDQYWPPERIHTPMGRFFENISFMDAAGGEIQGYLVLENHYVSAEATIKDGRPVLTQKGHLARRALGSPRGHVYFEKTIVFYDDHYDAHLLVQAPKDSEYRIRCHYASVWYDINDDWSNRFENSYGDLIDLRQGLADAPEAIKTHRFFSELDRGYGIWMAVSGPREEILVTTNDDTLKSLPYAGFTFFDGDDEIDPEADKYTSHSCMALGMISGQTQPRPFEPSTLRISYSVYFLPCSDFEKLYGRD